MLSGATLSAFAMAGTAVFRTVVSSDSMKKPTATSHGNDCFTESPGAARGPETALELAGIMLPPGDYLVVVKVDEQLDCAARHGAKTSDSVLPNFVPRWRSVRTHLPRRHRSHAGSVLPISTAPSAAPALFV